QKTSIPAPPIGLLVYDNTTNLFSYYDGTQWVDIPSSASGNSIWTSYVSNNETNVYNLLGQHVYIGGLPMQATNYSGNFDGVLRLSHGSQSPLTTNYYLTMDGQGLQARGNAGCLSCPTYDTHLLLNRYGGNVGIGLTGPTHAKLE